MNDTSGTPDEDLPATIGGSDDFTLVAKSADEERRLHLKAFDYWYGLKGENAYPLFTELRADDLAPFKGNSLLLEFNKNGAVVRFIGERVSLLVDAPIRVGSFLKDFPESAFARALLQQFDDETGRSRAAEFEFVEEYIDCRGIMLPFSNDGISPHFVMVISNFRQHENKVVDLAHDLDDLVSAGKRAAKGVSRIDNGSRKSLYGALASALAIYEGATGSEEAYSALLAGEGLKAQKRAPFTPALKIVFGAKYDKTRLTEYAATLSFAVRRSIKSQDLAVFIENTPGGIKGCVQQERALKRQNVGTPEYSRHQKAVSALLAAAPVALETINTDEDFCLVLARRHEGGGVEILGKADVGQTAFDAAIRNIAASLKQ
ncbi:MAG: hypothetical protein JKY34_08035 [Kordiimonadaceae bacterium]|nr:hypothetical protein [Kordiimonadaceae bacterium]